MLSSFSLLPDQTFQHLQAIASFLHRYRFLWTAHVVEFFQDRLWEDIDSQWWEDLQSVSIHDLLSLPSGKVQDCWCPSLKEFIETAQSLALFRHPDEEHHRAFPAMSKANLSNVLRQGMNEKKLHEVEILSAVVNHVAQTVQATCVVDVGAGQGYLSQVLAFEYGLPVVALDASSHHSNITDKRSGRIRKHYSASSRKSKQENWTQVTGPQTATFHVVPGSTEMELHQFLSNLLSSTRRRENCHNISGVGCSLQGNLNDENTGKISSGRTVHSLVLAGLHACGDLSATMLETYLSCKEVKAIVSVGCCYNLLSEKENAELSSSDKFGFPLSEGVNSLALPLGRRARDLACQSAERWRDIGPTSALYNFQQHTLRAGFQLVLHRYFPDLALLNPSIGRLGKARRRKQVRKAKFLEDDLEIDVKHLALREKGCKREEFTEFCHAAFERLGVECIAETALEEIWKEVEPKMALVGPYWSLRAVLGPVLETYILLDRLLYIQEQSPTASAAPDVDHVPGFSVPRLMALFDPEISPRNMAIIAIKS